MTDNKATAPTTEAPKMLTTRDLANRFKVKPTYLRRVLRKDARYDDGQHTKYGWDAKKDEKEIARIGTLLHASAAKAADKAIEAKNTPAKVA
jgi:hypothetical protein